MLQTFRLAARKLARAPGFAFTAVVILALGIGANSAIFSVLYSVVLRPLPFPDPDRLVIVYENDRIRGTQREAASIPDYIDIVKQATVFSELAARQSNNIALSIGEEAVRLAGARVTSNYFRTLGVEPALGRGFTSEETSPGRDRVVVLSDALWRERFGGDRSAIGRAVRLNGDNHTVVGVMPPAAASTLGGDDALWLPVAFDRLDMFRGRHTALLIGRLKTGVAIERAQAETTTIMKRLEAAYPDDNAGRGAWVRPLHAEITEQVRTALWALGGGVACLLLIACVNLTNLLLARSGLVSRELAVRRALGASRWRLIGQLLAEVLLIAAAGAAAGALLAAWGSRALVALAPVDLPLMAESGPDWRVLAAATGIALATAVLFGLAPALRLSGDRTERALREAGRAVSAGRGDQRFRQALVAVEVALSVVLLTGAGLMVRTMSRLMSVDPGLDPRGVLTASIDLPPARYPFPKTWPLHDWPQAQQFQDRLLEAVRAVTGVRSAEAALNRPLEGGWTTRVTIEGRPAPPPGQQDEARFRPVGEGYFEMLRIPLIAGRAFTRDDAKRPLVAVVNRAFVRRHFGGEEPLGRRVVVYGAPREIVGVVPDVKFRGLTAETPQTVYLPQRQNPMSTISITVRTSGDPMALLEPLRRAVASIDPEIPVYNAATLEEMLAGSVGERRFATLLLGVFAAVAGALALIGIHGVVNAAVSQRTREIGVRMAFGAAAGDVLRLIAGRGLALALAGVAAGLALAAALARFLGGLLYGVDRHDPATFAGVALAILAAAALAAYLPARRAARIEPSSALRYE
jgi:putative ABC transport system permease protein